MMSGLRLLSFSLLCALALSSAIPAAEEGGAEVVPLPDDTPAEKKAPPKQPGPAEKKSDTPAEPAAEAVPLDESPMEPAKPTPAANVAAPPEQVRVSCTDPEARTAPLKEPPEEVRVSITEPAAQAASLAEPAREPPKAPAKELVKEPPKQPVKPPEPAKPVYPEVAVAPQGKKSEESLPPAAETVPLPAPPKAAKPASVGATDTPSQREGLSVPTEAARMRPGQTAGPATSVAPAHPPAHPETISGPPEENNAGKGKSETPAETVPLPAAKPAPPPAKPAIIKPAVPDAVGDLETLALTADNLLVLPGQAAVFNLYGPEAFLRGATGRYVLRDEFGRLLAQDVVKVSALPFSEGKPRQLKVEIRNPLAPQHTLELTLTGADGKAVPLRCGFLVSRTQPWESWIALVATPPAGEAAQGAAGWTTLRSLGIRGGMQYRLSSARREALRQGNVPFYVENVGRQLLSRYHTERGLWEKTLAAMSADPSSRAPLMREPSLCSQAFAEDLAKELQHHAETYAKDQPLFYSLASEPSVTRLAAAADFDFSPESIQEFQRWLERDVYGTLKALNASWDTQFATWTDVVPMTTDEARSRLKDGAMNFGPWVDFRDFQDYMFSKVLRDSAEYTRRHDPKAKAGITGALGPFAFGGWDWSRLAQALDVVEAYDIGEARALWRDLAPGKPALAALSLVGRDGISPYLPGEDAQSAAAEAARTIWALALEGGPRGVVIWDEQALTADTQNPNSNIQNPDSKIENQKSKTENRLPALLDAEGKPTPLARTLAPLLKSLDGELGALLARSQRSHDGVAILYSPASVRLHWLFEAHRLHGDKWLAAWGADTGAERRESPQLRLRESWCKLLDDLGLSWRFVSSSQVENKEILKPEAGIKTIVLPRAIALSEREAAALKEFVANGGQIVADAACGRFDEHGRMRDKPALDDVFKIDTSTEPFAAQPLSPLERVQLERGTGPQPQSRDREGAVSPLADARGSEHGERPPFMTAQNLRNLAPVFSDQPKWLGPHPPALEYRHSPVLAVNESRAVYLNLDLTDYLRWRLHPDEPRAQAVREVVGGVAFAARLAEGLIDREHTRLPAGTQIAWLQVRGAPSSRLLALRRNPQTRLHELGSETDANTPFEKPEPFSLVLRKPANIEPLAPGPSPSPLGGEGGVRGAGVIARVGTKIEGILDPVTPALYLLSPANAGRVANMPRIVVSGNARAGEDLEINVVGAGDAGEKVCLFSLRLFAPDHTERAYLASTKYVTGGELHYAVPLALNEPPGAWKIQVRDLANGGVATASVEVSPAVESNR